MNNIPHNSLPAQLASQAETIVNTFEQSNYTYTPRIVAALGIYDCDCSVFITFVLEGLARRHYALIPCQADPPGPRAFEYFDFINSLTPQPSGGWRKIDRLADARRGDIVAWRFAEIESGHDTGHCFFVADTPASGDSGFFVVRVCDSASAAHFMDTRGPIDSGVGSGLINFEVDPDGRPISFQFAPGYGFVTVSIAIGRVEPFTS